MIEFTIALAVVSYVEGIYVGRHWKEFTEEE